MSVLVNFADIYILGMRDRSMRGGKDIVGRNPGNLFVNSRGTRQTGFCGFAQANKKTCEAH